MSMHMMSQPSELHFSSGESYSGTLIGNVPEGLGKYVWLDGCIYDGEWTCGMMHGNGIIQWPSGSVYEGEFSGGYMHGTGTLTICDNKIYKGRWRLNMKHGLGYQVYGNGDVFEGSWIQGSPEGPGKYVWANGNVYFGNMKKGKMGGEGTLTWTNGDSFEGNWVDGLMQGFGIYTWSEGGCYVGTWTRGLKDGKGTFYPKGNKIPLIQELYLIALRKRGLLPDLKHNANPSFINHSSHMSHSSSLNSSSQKLSKGNLLNLEQSRERNISLERRWSLEVSIERAIGHNSSLTCLSESVLEDGNEEIEANIPILEREYIQGVLMSEFVLSNSFSRLSKTIKRRQKQLTKELMKPGENIIKGHRSYDLMLNLQLGIRYTVGKITPTQRREVRTSDFGPQASFWMNFPKEGSQLTPTHQSEDFKWKDYCPMVFRDLREMFKIDTADYMMSICGNEGLRELSSPGKSGSVFFLSQDDRFMIKTLRKSEVKVLLQMLPKYHHHVRSYDNTLVTKFFGLHRIIPPSGQKFRFVVMGNMFCTELRIHRRFDLKGSSLGRSTTNVEIHENTTLKDLDLNYCFYLEPSWREALLNQIETDSKFLEAQNIMDYSLLLGVHYRAPRNAHPLMVQNQGVSSVGSGLQAEDGDVLNCVFVFEGSKVEGIEDDEISNYPEDLVLVPHGTNGNSFIAGSHIRGSRLRVSSADGGEEVDLLLPGTARLQIQLGVNMPARAEQISGQVEQKTFHEAYDVVLYVGIIDILQEYNVRKKIEHTFKSFQFDSLSISAVDPRSYSCRFLHFIRKVFPSNVVKP